MRHINEYAPRRIWPSVLVIALHLRSAIRILLRLDRLAPRVLGAIVKRLQRRAILKTELAHHEALCVKFGKHVSCPFCCSGYDSRQFVSIVLFT
jgi:hypothetical protein